MKIYEIIQVIYIYFIFVIFYQWMGYIEVFPCKHVNGKPLRDPIPRVKYIVASRSISSFTFTIVSRIWEGKKENES